MFKFHKIKGWTIVSLGQLITGQKKWLEVHLEIWCVSFQKVPVFHFASVHAEISWRARGGKRWGAAVEVLLYRVYTVDVCVCVLCSHSQVSLSNCC